MQFELSSQEIQVIIEPTSVAGNFPGKITSIAGLAEAKSEQISFLSNPKYAKDVKTSDASIILLPENLHFNPKQNQMVMFCQNPSISLARICLHISQQNNAKLPEIHTSAVIHETAILGENIFIGANVVIEENVKLGNNITIGANCFIGKYSSIGDNSRLLPNVNIMQYSEIGSHVIIHSGAVIGSDGFGFAKINDKHEKIPQIGNVILENYVDIGANTTIDCARFTSTIIGEGTKIDNLVQIGHNVKIGKNCIIVAQTGIAGSTTIGNNVTIGGQCGVAGHLHIADGTQICAQSGVTKNSKENSILFGSPATNYKDAVKQIACMTKLPQLMKKVNNIVK